MFTDVSCPLCGIAKFLVFSRRLDFSCARVSGFVGNQSKRAKERKRLGGGHT